MMPKWGKNVIAIVAGTLVCFLVWKFVRVSGPVGQYFNHFILLYAIIAVTASIFGWLAGGAAGILGYAVFLTTLSSFNKGGVIQQIIIMGLLGLLVGLICNRFVVTANKNTLLKTIVIIFFTTFVLVFLSRLILLFIELVNIKTNNPNIGIQMTLLTYLPLQLKPGLSVAVLSSLSVFIYLVCAGLKINAKNTQPITQEEGAANSAGQNEPARTVNMEIKPNNVHLDKKFFISLALFAVGFFVGRKIWGQELVFGLFGGLFLGGIIWGWLLVRKWFPPAKKEERKEHSDSAVFLSGAAMIFKVALSLLVGIIAMPYEIIKGIVTVIIGIVRTMQNRAARSAQKAAAASGGNQARE